MRLDRHLAEKFGSRNKAASAIERGIVRVNGMIRPASYDVKESDVIDVAEEGISFVSAGGYKLYKALTDFNFSVKDKVFADIGASTGGFTDCLLKCGAKKVYCIDVGESQLDKSLMDKNIVVIDNFNARNLRKDMFEEELDGITIDVSFISLTYLFEAVCEVLCHAKYVLALIKPQFECGSRAVGKNGIVRGEKRHREIIDKIYASCISCGLAPMALTNAPEVKGKNLEYVVLLEKGGEPVQFEKLIAGVKL